MTKFIVIIIIFNLFNLAQAQSGELEEYYSLIYKAEDFILEKNYDSTTYYYEKAFLMFPDNFVPDLNNALVAAIESDNYTKADKYLTLLLQSGVPRSFFEKKLYFKQFVGTEVFAALDRPFHNKIDSVKIKLIDSLLVIDQYPRVNNLLDSILEVDIKNEIILEKQIFSDGLIPTAYEIGLEIYNDTITSSSNLSILLIHQIRNNPAKYKEFYRENLRKKRISPLQYLSKANLFTERTPDELIGCEERLFAVIQYIDEDGFTCCCNLKDQVNKNRKKYFLEDIVSAIKKYRFVRTTSLPFMMEKGLHSKLSFYDPKKSEEAKNKLLADPNFVRFEEN